MKDYPKHYHNAVAAVVRSPYHRRTRGLVATSLRLYRQAGDHQSARKLRSHVYWIGYCMRSIYDARIQDIQRCAT